MSASDTSPGPQSASPTFAELGVAVEICEALAAQGITRTFAIQELTLPLALDGTDLIGQARTGMGKTLGFGVPLLDRVFDSADVEELDGTPRALVVVPTRELAVQVGEDLARAAAKLPVRLTTIYGGRPYEEQIEAIESLGGRIILMASRALAAAAASPDDYVRVYDRILSQVQQPVVLHWLGEMFDPALEGYWGSGDHMAAMDTCLGVIAAHADKVDGIKVSLLSKEKEIAMRRRLPAGVRMYTGDDFNYAELIAGDASGHSHALLGIFDAIAPAASAGLAALGKGNNNEFFDLLEPTVPLSRHIFAAPTRFYKTGVVFMAWLNGHQDHFVMVGGQQSTRSVQHLSELFRLADKARVLSDPDLAVKRMKAVLDVNSVLTP